MKTRYIKEEKSPTEVIKWPGLHSKNPCSVSTFSKQSDDKQKKSKEEKRK